VKVKIQISKFKIIIKKLKLRKTFAFLLVFLTFNFYLLTTVYAQSATPSSGLKDKIEELKKEIASKAAKLKQEVNKKLQNKAYYGLIKKKSVNSLTIATKSGSKIINVNQDTIFQGTAKNKQSLSSSKKVTLDTLKDEDLIVGMGDIDDSLVLSARKIILLPSNINQKEKLAWWGEITAIMGTKISIEDKSSQIKTVFISDEAQIKNASDEIAIDKLKIGDIIVASGMLDTNQNLVASFIYLTGKPATKTEKMASPSATLKPTPKPSLKPSPS
jgi:hypothetical protein